MFKSLYFKFTILLKSNNTASSYNQKPWNSILQISIFLNFPQFPRTSGCFIKRKISFLKIAKSHFFFKLWDFLPAKFSNNKVVSSFSSRTFLLKHKDHFHEMWCHLRFLIPKIMRASRTEITFNFWRKNRAFLRQIWSSIS